MKLCVDCKHFVRGKKGPSLFSPIFDYPELCSHPDFRHPVTGELSSPYANRNAGMYSGGRCGEEGKGFEVREAAKKETA